jgi:phosphatidylinositol alpha-mannosyltransferase
VRWLVPRLDVRCAVSEDARAMAQEALGGEYELVFNGIEVDRVAAVTPAPTSGPTVFFIGRHEPRKGLDVLLAALAELPADTRLWIAGDGPDTRLLQARVTGDPRVEWLGRIGDEEKYARLRAADVFCAPSLRGESFGIVLLEAMAAGAALVASDLPGYANVARAGRDAVLVPPGDAPALAKAICSVLDSPLRRSELVASGHERAEQFSMSRLADVYIDYYRQVIQ